MAQIMVARFYSKLGHYFHIESGRISPNDSLVWDSSLRGYLSGDMELDLK